MRVIKNINNNVSICLDSTGKHVVAFGKGIGFGKPPYEIDITKIERTFYDIDSIYLQTINNIPEKIIEISAQTVDFARKKVEYLINSSIVFTLADHLAFALQRFRKNMILNMPIYYDVKSLYQDEYEIGDYALKLIKMKYNIILPRDEITGIALHFINAAAMTKKKKNDKDNKDVIRDIKKLVEDYLCITIRDDDFNYSRFVSHLQYLLKRGEQGKSICTENHELYASMKEKYPDIYACACRINNYLREVYKYIFDEEELLYLMLHINRLYVREDCYR